MKKVFAILAVAGVMAACNNGENKEIKADTPVIKVDSAAVKVDSAALLFDSLVVKDTGRPKGQINIRPKRK